MLSLLQCQVRQSVNKLLIQFMNYFKDFLIANLSDLPIFPRLPQPYQPLRILRIVQILTMFLVGLLVLKAFHTLEIPINCLVVFRQYFGKFRVTLAHLCGTYILAGSAVRSSDTVTIQRFLFRFGNKKVSAIFSFAEIHIILQEVYEHKPQIIFKRFKPITFCKWKIELGHIEYPRTR